MSLLKREARNREQIYKMAYEIFFFSRNQDSMGKKKKMCTNRQGHLHKSECGGIPSLSLPSSRTISLNSVSLGAGHSFPFLLLSFQFRLLFHLTWWQGCSRSHSDTKQVPKCLNTTSFSFTHMMVKQAPNHGHKQGESLSHACAFQGKSLHPKVTV